MRKYQLLLITFILIGLLISTYYLTAPTEEEITNDLIVEEQVIGGQKDEHGCLGSAGYSWCEASQKCVRIWEEGCDDEIFKLSQAIEAETGINFVDQGEYTFNWLVRDEDENVFEKLIEGRRIEASNVEKEKIQEIEEFFQSNGSEDMLNVADGVFAGLRGYTYHYMVCVFSWQQEGENADIQIDCGFFNE